MDLDRDGGFLERGKRTEKQGFVMGLKSIKREKGFQ